MCTLLGERESCVCTFFGTVNCLQPIICPLTLQTPVSVPFSQVLPEGKIFFLAKGRDGGDDSDEDKACARSLARSTGSVPVGGNWCACYSTVTGVLDTRGRSIWSDPAEGPAGCEQNLITFANIVQGGT